MGSIKRTITIVASTVTKIFPFPQDDVLQNAKSIDLIEAFKVGDVSLAPDGQTVISDTVYKKSFLTMVSADEDVVFKIPLSSLNRKDNGGFVVPLNLTTKIQVTRCNISIPETTGLTAGEAWVLCVHYTK